MEGEKSNASLNIPAKKKKVCDLSHTTLHPDHFSYVIFFDSSYDFWGCVFHVCERLPSSGRLPRLFFFCAAFELLHDSAPTSAHPVCAAALVQAVACRHPVRHVRQAAAKDQKRGLEGHGDSEDKKKKGGETERGEEKRAKKHQELVGRPETAERCNASEAGPVHGVDNLGCPPQWWVLAWLPIRYLREACSPGVLVAGTGKEQKLNPLRMIYDLPSLDYELRESFPTNNSPSPPFLAFSTAQRKEARRRSQGWWSPLPGKLTKLCSSA